MVYLIFPLFIFSVLDVEGALGVRCGGGKDILNKKNNFSFKFSCVLLFLMTVCGKGMREMRWRQRYSEKSA
jgi:hypothetical protein